MCNSNKIKKYCYLANSYELWGLCLSIVETWEQCEINIIK